MSEVVKVSVDIRVEELKDKSLWEPIPESEKMGAEALTAPQVTFWGDVWRRFRKNRLAVIGLVLLVIILLFALVGPLVSPYPYDKQDYNAILEPPNFAHPFGTDYVGRDLFTRVMYGARISLAVGFLAAMVQLVIGVLYGGISGFMGGKVDEIMMRIVDIMYAIPILLIVILLMVVLGPGLVNIFLALGFFYWLGMARIVRSQILTLKEEEFVLAARVLGASTKRLLLRHLIPNAMGPVIVTVTLNIPNAIFTEAFLSYIGLGVSAPMASLGSLASDGVEYIRTAPWLMLFPALTIALIALAFNFVGDGLRDSLDPRLRR
ncbi:ABC transporter permease subunit [bacterium 3DAC]|nr:ABC transporter permease subunit [bacterium 3DAC]